MIGGTGNDSYIVNRPSVIEIDEDENGGRDTVWTSLGSFSLDAIRHVERLRGTSDGGQTLTGNDASNVITGGNGDDTLVGKDGNDILRGGFGSDNLVGGSNTDRASYTWALSGVTAALDGSLEGTGQAQGDTYDSIEDLTGSAYGDDTLVGNNANNKLFGW
jgi:Ca2+-binding RTX toxin-like protein